MTNSFNRRWGLSARHRDNLFRFLAFAILHLANYVTNMMIVLHVMPAMKEEWGKAGYVIILGFAQAIVGVYCVLLAWGDPEIKRTCYSRQCLGLLGHSIISVLLGFTQLIQLKVAWGKYTRRRSARRDDELDEDEDLEDDSSGNFVDGERRRVAILENIIPWTFPSKCLEGMFEGIAFALVELYVVLKIGWHGDPKINQLFNQQQNTMWYCLITVSGILSFSTIGVSMLNFDYHLSPAVQKTIDHSLRYTLIHLIFRACEVGTRLAQIIFFVLAFRSCTLPMLRTLPYFLLLLDYSFCVATMFAISAPEERQYPGLASLGGLVKRIALHLSVGLLLFFANLAEFVDAVERGLLRDAAIRFSQVIRTFRCVELILLLICLSVEKYCPVPMIPPDHPDGHTHPEAVDFWTYCFERHYLIFAAATVATTVYYVLLCFGFHRLVSRSTEDLMTTHLGRLSVSVLYLPSDLPRPDEERPRALPPVPEHEAVAAAAPEAAGAGDAAASSGAVPLLDPAGNHPGTSSRSRRAAGAARQQEVPIIRASDSDLPNAMSDGQPANDTFYHNVSPEVRVRRAPSLSFLLLSRGVHGSVADGILATINEDDVLPTDIVTVGTRVRMSDFELLERLGRGAYAPVFRARKRGSSEFFAMKRLVKHNYVQRSPVEAELPRRERDTLFMAGQHPYVAGLHYAFETDTFWVLVTEFCTLGSLSKHLREQSKHLQEQRQPGPRGLRPAEVARLGGHILQALSHLHGCSILHRDIKPDNIGISGTREAPIAKLLDFGFAKRADARQSRTIVGSFGYCAPEIDNARHVFGALRQAREAYDERIDLYSTGVVLMVILVGREAQDLNGDLWTHRQLHEMLRDPGYGLWNCPRYRNLGIDGPTCFSMLQSCGALETVKKLTATQAQNRPSTARAAGHLPLFTRHPGSLPEGWADEQEGGGPSTPVDQATPDHTPDTADAGAEDGPESQGEQSEEAGAISADQSAPSPQPGEELTTERGHSDPSVAGRTANGESNPGSATRSSEANSAGSLECSGPAAQTR